MGASECCGGMQCERWWWCAVGKADLCVKEARLPRSTSDGSTCEITKPLPHSSLPLAHFAHLSLLRPHLRVDRP